MRFFPRRFSGSLLFAFIALIPKNWSIAADVPKPASVETNDAVANAVVKVFSHVRYPDTYKPWTKQPTAEVTGSGVVIDGKRILSNAHVVMYASQVQIQANQSGDKIPATVEAIAPGIDLAVLKLEDETFFETHKALAMSKTLPEIKDTVMAYGYPEGGTSLSITKGIVSRIDFTAYNSPVSGLRIQIDAAINPGNSGGPAVAGDKMIGLAFSRLDAAQNIGYIIPNEEIELFLQDVADGHYDGKPAMFDHLQTLENPALRNYLKVDKSIKGIVVNKPESTDPSYPLKEWDVITRIGGTPVDDQGMIELSQNIRVDFRYGIQKIAQHGKVPLTVVRAGKEVTIELPVSPNRPEVIPGLNGAYPSYFVYGPLVFSTATKEFVSPMISGPDARRYIALIIMQSNPLVARSGDKPAFVGENLVVVTSPFFPHKLSRGYEEAIAGVVKSVNNIRVRNLAHLVEILRDCKDEFVVFEFDTRDREKLVFPRAEMAAATDEILSDNGIRTQGSPDTLAVWQAKPGSAVPHTATDK
jgi:S1-C subfamily serine protease